MKRVCTTFYKAYIYQCVRLSNFPVCGVFIRVWQRWRLIPTWS